MRRSARNWSAGWRWRTLTAREKVGAVTSLYDALHIDELAKEKINQYFKESKAYLDAVSVAEDRKKELRAYADRMMRRNK